MARRYANTDLYSHSAPLVIATATMIGALMVFPRASILILSVAVYLSLVFLAVIARLPTQRREGSLE